MKILELTNYTAGICGVGNRVKEEARLLAKMKYEVKIFSSDFIKGSKKRAPQEDRIGDVSIKRFPGQKLGGESYMAWSNFGELQKEIKTYSPKVIIAHAYRHTHTVIASHIAKSIGARSFLVTHAPFVEDDSTRSFLAKWYVRIFHDPLVGKSTLKRFDKIIAITRWEIPYLEKLGVPRHKIAYIPNGIPDEFFKEKKGQESDKILYFGRISPIKKLETLIDAFSIIQDKGIILELVGPAEKDYLEMLVRKIADLNLQKRIVITGPIFDLTEKIKKIDSASIIVLPSKREAMPQSLIEAMARQKIVVASDNPGTHELIEHGRNGFLFPVGDSKELAILLDHCLSNNLSHVKKKARVSVERFKWTKLIQNLDVLIRQDS